MSDRVEETLVISNSTEVLAEEAERGCLLSVEEGGQGIVEVSAMIHARADVLPSSSSPDDHCGGASSAAESQSESGSTGAEQMQKKSSYSEAASSSGYVIFPSNERKPASRGDEFCSKCA